MAEIQLEAEPVLLHDSLRDVLPSQYLHLKHPILARDRPDFVHDRLNGRIFVQNHLTNYVLVLENPLLQVQMGDVSNSLKRTRNLRVFRQKVPHDLL